MSVFKRVGRLVKADIHGILDCLEEPEAIARQAVREMREEIERCERELETVTSEAARVERCIAQTDSNIAGFDEQLELCLGAGDENLAKSIVRKRLEYQRTIKALSESKTRIEQEIEARTKQLEDYQQRLQSIEQKLELLAKQESVASDIIDDSIFREPMQSVSDEEVEIAFLREKQRFAGSSAAAEEVAS